MKKETLLEQHQNHQTWLNYLSFYADELQILQKRLEEIAKKYTDQDILVEVEHFQNQFILQKEQLDLLKHEIGSRENQIESAFTENSILAGNRRPDAEEDLAEQVDTYVRLFHDMKDDFYRFVARYL